jgi:hypothetical protein
MLFLNICHDREYYCTKLQFVRTANERHYAWAGKLQLCMLVLATSRTRGKARGAVMSIYKGKMI